MKPCTEIIFVILNKLHKTAHISLKIQLLIKKKKGFLESKLKVCSFYGGSQQKIK